MDNSTLDCCILVVAGLLMVVYVPVQRPHVTENPILEQSAPATQPNVSMKTWPDRSDGTVVLPALDAQTTLFAEFIHKHNRSYRIGSRRYNAAFRAFKESLSRAARLNAAGEGDAVYGITRFSDYSEEQFALQFLSKRTERIKLLNNSRHLPLLSAPQIELPLKVDWRDRLVVTGVNDQGACGACWAFSDVETLESMYAISTGNLTRLSAQELIDCSLGGLGCVGGDICSTLDWMSQHAVLPSPLYPLTLHDNRCALRTSMEESGIGVRVREYACLSMVGSELLMLQLLAQHGPLTAAVDATSWRDYLGGVIRYNCEASVNHAVQIVGYDLSDPLPHFIVRNSWGTAFGMDGYLKIAIGQNVCGIAVEVAYLNV